MAATGREERGGREWSRRLMRLCGEQVIDEGGLFVSHGGFTGRGERADTHTSTPAHNHTEQG